MKKYSIEMNRNFASKIEDMSKSRNGDQALVISHAIALYASVKEQEERGYNLVLSKDGEVSRQIKL